MQKINNVFEDYPEVDKAILYGSRAKGNHRAESDIDIALVGDRITLTLLSKIAWQLDDLLLPYKIDLSIFNHIKQPDLLDHISRVGVNFYERE